MMHQQTDNSMNLRRVPAACLVTLLLLGAVQQHQLNAPTARAAAAATLVLVLVALHPHDSCTPLVIKMTPQAKATRLHDVRSSSDKM